MAHAAKKASAAKPAQDKGAAPAAPAQPASDAGAATPSTTGAGDMKPLGGEVAGQVTDAAAIDPTGASTPAAGAGEGNAQAGTDEQTGVVSSEATQPVGDPVPPPVAASDPADAADGFVVTDRTVLRVVGPKQGRRRAGRMFGREPVAIPLDELGRDELMALLDDRRLDCTFVEADVNAQIVRSDA